jgi:microcystin-dependent protein
MTVSSTTTKVSYSGDASTAVFAYTFKIFDADELVVITRVNATGAETTETLNTAYIVDGVDNANGGNVTFKYNTGNPSDPNYSVTDYRPQTGETVVIKRVLPLTQTTDYTPNDPFPAEVHEESLDKLTFMSQQQQEEIDRSFKFSETDTGTASIPTASVRANKYLGFDADGDVVAVEGTSSDITVSTYGQTLVDDADASAARATLGLGFVSTLSSIATANITDANVTTAKIADSAVTTAKINDEAVTSAKLASGLAFVSGMLMPYAGSSAPTGWLLCYGQSLSRTTYADLFAAIGTTYGSADGDSFNAPDLRGRTIAGQDDMGGSSANRLTDAITGGLNGDTLGDTGGTESHTLTSAQSGLVGHTHGVSASLEATTGAGSAETGVDPGDGAFQGNNAADNTSMINVSISAVASADASEAHNNVQPTIILNYIIKT